MTAKYLTRRNCDRCKEVVEVAGEQRTPPVKWGTVTMRIFADGKWSEANKEVCPKCFIEILTVVDGPAK